MITCVTPLVFLNCSENELPSVSCLRSASFPICLALIAVTSDSNFTVCFDAPSFRTSCSLGMWTGLFQSEVSNRN